MYNIVFVYMPMGRNGFFYIIQSTLVISKSKGLSEILRDISTSIYPICRTEEKNKLNNPISQMLMYFES